MGLTVSEREGKFLWAGGLANVASPLAVIICVLTLGITAGHARAATRGLPFTEDFSADNLKDPASTATWSTAERKAYLAWRHSQYNAFGADTVGADITAATHFTQPVALGDVDRDGSLDMIAGNYDLANRLYRNAGETISLDGVNGTALALGERP